MRWEVHTHRVLTELHDVLVQLQNAETGQRGYIITGDARYLEPYHGAAASAASELALLRRLTADNPRQQRLLDTLEPLISAKFAELESTIRLRESGRNQAAVRVVQSGKGRALMRRIQEVIGAMESEEDALLNGRSSEAETGARQAIALIAFGSLVALAFVATAILVIHRDLTARRRAEKALEKAFGELEVRVSERTAELARANQDLHVEIAERKRADSELARSHDDMLSILDRLQVGTAMTGHDGRLVYLSRVAQRLFEAREQALGAPWQHVLTLSGRGTARLSEMAELPSAKRVKIPAHVETKSRRHYWMEIDVQDDPRDPHRKIFFFYDLSEVYDLRRALDEKAQFYGLVGESPAMRAV
ncbi:MAG: CHASE3 domain-containing protein [Gammaproteobacteria bacterium]|nr:CHASE3 domain-containing protein [Gammaproteobacteria bacterium]